MECAPNPECKLWERGQCKMDTHHEYWPKRDYRTQVEREFRSLPENQVELCRAEHDTLHETTLPPIKPNRDFMLSAIQRATRGAA